jgi:hypothetical protein
VIPDSQSSPSSTSIPYAALLSELYLSVSDHSSTLSRASTALLFTDTQLEQMQHTSNNTSSPPSNVIIDNHLTYIQTKKKYKPIAQKVRPVITDLPNRFRIVRNIIRNPLENMPKLNPHPPTFVPTPRYSLERAAFHGQKNEH